VLKVQTTYLIATFKPEYKVHRKQFGLLLEIKTTFFIVPVLKMDQMDGQDLTLLLVYQYTKGLGMKPVANGINKIAIDSGLDLRDIKLESGISLTSVLEAYKNPGLDSSMKEKNEQKTREDATVLNLVCDYLKRNSHSDIARKLVDKHGANPSARAGFDLETV